MEENLDLPTNPFRKAADYALTREKSLRVFLEYPDVPLDTNHLERAIRPIAMGRKNWLFCWTEVGAKYVGIFQSLLSTCRVQGINPYTYLVDVLQRIDTHPASEVEWLDSPPLEGTVRREPAALRHRPQFLSRRPSIWRLRSRTAYACGWDCGPGEPRRCSRRSPEPTKIL